MQMEKPKMAPTKFEGIARVAVPLIAVPLAIYTAALSSPAAANDKEFGCTVRQNIEVQTVNLDPRYEGTLMEGGVGLRSAAAIRRYMTDKVRPLPGSSLSSSVGQQGGATTGSGDVALTGQGK
jgi:hypothetical protein